MQVRCPGCQSTLSVNQKSQPIRVKCPKCEKLLQIPATATPSKPAPQRQMTPPAPSAVQSAVESDASNDPFGNLPDLPPASAASNFPNPVANPDANPGGRSPAKRVKTKTTKPKSGVPAWVLAVAGVAMLFVLPLVWFVASSLIGGGKTAKPVANASATRSATSNAPSVGKPASTAPPSRQPTSPPVSESEDIYLPDLSPPVHRFPSGVTLHNVKVSNPTVGPAHNMKMRVYLPKDFKAESNAPCVLVAPAGTPLLYGASVDDGDYHDETLPYAEAGMVAVHYSIDGAIPDGVDQDNQRLMMSLLPNAFGSFKAAGGGVANGRVALQFAIEKIEGVDAKRICAAGHSSAGTLALALAAADPRVTHCAAYAASYDTEKRMADAINDPTMQSLLPGIKPFIHSYSPSNYINDLKCKLLIFHARDDSNVPYGDAVAFTTKLKATNKNVLFVQAARGGHYQPMIDQGIPAAIKWLGE